MNEERHCVLPGRVVNKSVQRRRLWDGFAVLDRSGDVPSQCFGRHAVRFFQQPGKSGELTPKSEFGSLLRYAMYQPLPKAQPR
jgi:hypothetical protein